MLGDIEQKGASMSKNHKFRFGVQTSQAPSREAWIEKARKIEDLGFSSLFLPDHFGEQLSPIPALMSAADATTRLRVGSLVLDNDFKHPVVLAKEAASLDLLSGGRLELGVGAGWMKSDYDRSGIPFDTPAVRVDRLEESVRILKGLLAGEHVQFSGKHYQVDMIGKPQPAQQPRPPLLIGGGGKRVLQFAAREADIIGINFKLAEGVVNPAALATGTGEATARKMRWIESAAGDRYEQIELSSLVFAAIVTNDREKMAEQIAPRFGVKPSELSDAPHVLLGSVEQIVDDLQMRREKYGLSYTIISGDGFEPLAPVVKKLAGT